MADTVAANVLPTLTDGQELKEDDMKYVKSVAVGLMVVLVSIFIYVGISAREFTDVGFLLAFIVRTPLWIVLLPLFGAGFWWQYRKR